MVTYPLGTHHKHGHILQGSERPETHTFSFGLGDIQSSEQRSPRLPEHPLPQECPTGPRCCLSTSPGARLASTLGTQGRTLGRAPGCLLQPRAWHVTPTPRGGEHRPLVSSLLFGHWDSGLSFWAPLGSNQAPASDHRPADLQAPREPQTPAPSAVGARVRQTCSGGGLSAGSGCA